MIVLGVETSCDETSAAVVRDGALLSNVVSSQAVHAKYGGIVPELASREHIKGVIPIIRAALTEAAITTTDLDAAAATQGPGLIGALLVGLHAAKGIAIAQEIPFIPVNHIEAHMFSPFIEGEAPAFPYLALVVSGGHTLLVRIDGIGSYSILGSTIDDAAGEAYDKVGKMLGLGFPGGPAIDKLAADGNPSAIDFPRPKLDSDDYQFSFSGLKTAVLYYLRDNKPDGFTESEADRKLLADICASFQQAVTDVLVRKTLRAAANLDITDIAVVGGVSANSGLQRSMRERCANEGRRVFIPDVQYSTDNAAMIATLAYLKIASGEEGTLHSPAYARMPEVKKHG